MTSRGLRCCPMSQSLDTGTRFRAEWESEREKQESNPCPNPRGDGAAARSPFCTLSGGGWDERRTRTARRRGKAARRGAAHGSRGPDRPGSCGPMGTGTKRVLNRHMFSPSQKQSPRRSGALEFENAFDPTLNAEDAFRMGHPTNWCIETFPGLKARCLVGSIRGVKTPRSLRDETSR